jgi:ABC-type lipoprotein export system ATPase subunit
MAMNAPAAVSFNVQNVTFAYPGRLAKDALAGVTVQVPADQSIAVVGANGSGKSTLLYLLGLLWDKKLKGGRIEYRDSTGKEVSLYDGLSRDGQAALRLREFGFAFHPNLEPLLPQLTGLDNIALPLLLQGETVTTSRERARPLVEHAFRPGERDDLHRGAGELSSGQQQRVAVLRALICNPRVLFADEPFLSLDPRNTDLVEQLMRDWRNGEGPFQASGGPRTLILVVQEPERAYKLTDCFVVLYRKHKDGRCRRVAKSDLTSAADLKRLMGEEEDL